MTQTLQDLLPQVQQLSSEDRAELASILLRSLEPEEDPEDVAAAWAEELERREEEIRSGKVVAIPHEQVMAELRKLTS